MDYSNSVISQGPYVFLIFALPFYFPTSCRAVWIPSDASNATVNMEVWQDNLLEMSLWLETGTIKVNGFLGYTARFVRNDSTADS